MNTCFMNGSHDLAVSPSVELRVGTVRQPSTVWPSDCTICSKRSSMRRRTVGLRGRKTMPQPYSPGARHDDAGLLARLDQKLVRHLQQHAGAVAGVHLRAAGAAVVQIREDLQALLQDRVRFAALDVDDEADAAGVMLEGGVVQTLLRQAAPSIADDQRWRSPHFRCVLMPLPVSRPTKILRSCAARRRSLHALRPVPGPSGRVLAARQKARRRARAATLSH